MVAPIPRSVAASALRSISVVIPAYNAERTVGKVVEGLREQEPPPDEIIVVDDGSSDGTAGLAERLGARVVRTERSGYAGGARNRGWDAATGDVVVFLDADSVPAPGWGTGLARALAEFPGAIVGCARTFSARTAWGWVGYLQSETPYLPLGEPRRVAFVCSYCMAVPRHAPRALGRELRGRRRDLLRRRLGRRHRPGVRPPLPDVPRPREGLVREPAPLPGPPRVQHRADRPGAEGRAPEASPRAGAGPLLRPRAADRHLPGG